MSLKYLSSFLVGFIVGAGVALMLAPMPGKRMQRKLVNEVADKFDDLRDVARRVAS
jgi:gas vesicle protein